MILPLTSLHGRLLANLSGKNIKYKENDPELVMLPDSGFIFYKFTAE